MFPLLYVYTNAHLEELVWPVGSPDAELLQQLHHEPCKPLKCARQPHVWADLNYHVFVGVHVYCLQRGRCMCAPQPAPGGGALP